MLVSQLITLLQAENGDLPVCCLEQNGTMYFTALENIEVVSGKLYLGTSDRINQVITYLATQKTQAQAQVDYHTQATIDQQAVLDGLNDL